MIKHLIGLVGIIFIMTMTTACSDQAFSTRAGSNPSVNQSGDSADGNDLMEEVDEDDLDEVDEVKYVVDEYPCNKKKKYKQCGDENIGDGGDGGGILSSSLENKKVEVCHVPNGNMNAAHEICISIKALRAHLKGPHRDYLGKCN